MGSVFIQLLLEFYHIHFIKNLKPNNFEQTNKTSCYFKKVKKTLCFAKIQYSSGGFSQTHRSRWGMKLSGED